MPVTVKELRRSQAHVSGTTPTARREYMAWGSDDGDAIENAVVAVAPIDVNGLLLETVNCEPTDEDESVWNVSIDYKRAASTNVPAETGGEEISFELGSQSVTVTQNPITNGTSGFAEQGQKAADFKGAIGYDGEKFLGVERMIETFSFSITQYVKKSDVEKAAYIKKLRDAAFTTNDQPFRGFAAGEVLFIGASGSKRSSTDYAITFKFLVGKNVAQFQVGNITVPSKGAWDYLWVYYQDIEDLVSNPKTIKKVPVWAYVEKLYVATNFPGQIGVNP